jgi:hypothetical protein
MIQVASAEIRFVGSDNPVGASVICYVALEKPKRGAYIGYMYTGRILFYTIHMCITLFNTPS